MEGVKQVIMQCAINTSFSISSVSIQLRLIVTLPIIVLCFILQSPPMQQLVNFSLRSVDIRT